MKSPRRASIDRDSAGPAIARTTVSRAWAVPAVLLAGLSGGCAVVTVADAAVTVAATVVTTAVKVGATVVNGAVDVTNAGVRAVANNAGQKN
jgi:hypothetical protein